MPRWGKVVKINLIGFFEVFSLIFTQWLLRSVCHYQTTRILEEEEWGERRKWFGGNDPYQTTERTTEKQVQNEMNKNDEEELWPFKRTWIFQQRMRECKTQTRWWTNSVTELLTERILWFTWERRKVFDLYFFRRVTKKTTDNYILMLVAIFANRTENVISQ